jgi:hypothetical protein
MKKEVAESLMGAMKKHSDEFEHLKAAIKTAAKQTDMRQSMFGAINIALAFGEVEDKKHLGLMVQVFCEDGQDSEGRALKGITFQTLLFILLASHLNDNAENMYDYIESRLLPRSKEKSVINLINQLIN